MSSVDDTILSLGQFQFSVSTAAFEQLQRSSGWEWAEQQIYGSTPRLHFTGKAAETITLQCTQSPSWRSPLRNGQTQAATMRDLADAATPYALVAETGGYLGEWVIVSVSETQSAFIPDGAPLRVTFDLQLKRYS